MTKSIFILFILSLCLSLSKAQSDSIPVKAKSKMIVSVAGGLALPTGAISFNKSPANTESSIAGDLSKGYYGKLEFFYCFSENSGASAMFFSTVNQAISSKDINPNYVITNETGPCCLSVYAVDYGTKNWYTNSLLIGLYREIHFYKFALNFKISGGCMQAKSPESYMHVSGYRFDVHLGPTYPYNDFTGKITQPGISSYNFAGYAGIDLSLNVYKSFRLKIGVDELLSFTEYNGQLTIVEDTHNGNGTITHSEETQRLNFIKNISLFCYNAGISYVIK